MYIEGENQKEAKRLTALIKKEGKELEEMMLMLKNGEYKLEDKEIIINRNLPFVTKKKVFKDNSKVKQKVNNNEAEYERD